MILPVLVPDKGMPNRQLIGSYFRGPLLFLIVDGFRVGDGSAVHEEDLENGPDQAEEQIYPGVEEKGQGTTEVEEGNEEN